MKVSATTWSTLSKLLDEALDLDPPARATWLEQLSVSRPALAPSVRKLLEAHASSETADVLAHLPTLGSAASATRLSALAPGDRIGPYRLKREIGTGGMADVWLAERADGAFTRDVALKLPLINRLRRDLAARFIRERDILARLEHPHVARLYDAGVTDGGLPYLAMEYVDGQPITAYCDAQRLGVHQRLRLFAQVLDAVQYAHANLVIHRDLKPSNILVTADEQVRLLDFGIAKLLADDDTARETQLTQLSGRALTPDYASPEQIKGESLSIATDVYSLGVVLYELLTGNRPYRLSVQSVAQLEQAIITAEPRLPSNAVTEPAAQARASTRPGLARALSSDLDTITLKALAKTPAERYSTIAAFADDLQRHIDGHPVRAQPASWAYRARKFVIRNRLVVGAATAISVAMIAALSVSLWQAQRAREQATRADEVKRFVLSIFEGADTGGGGSRKTTAVDLLRQARERLAAAPVNDPAIAVELLTSIGVSLVLLGELRQAVPVLEEATGLAVSHLGEAHPNTLAAQMAYGRALLQTGERKRAAPLLDAAERGMRRTNNTVGLVNALRWTSFLRFEEGRFEESIALATEAVHLAETELAATHKRALMESYIALTGAMAVTRREGRLDPARRAYALARDIHGEAPNSVVLGVRSLYASALVDAGDAEVGISELKAIVQQRIELLGPDHREVRQSFSQIGSASLSRGDPLTAIDSYRQAVRIELAISGDMPTSGVGTGRLSLGTALARARRYPEAEVELRQANEVFAATLDPDHYFGRMARANTGFVLTQVGRVAEADALFTELLARPFGTPTEAAYVKVRLGNLRSAQGKHAEAQILLREAVDFFSKQPKSDSYAVTLAALGAVQLEGGRATEAIDTLQEAKALFEKLHANGSPDHADLLVNLARAQMALSRIDEAVTASERAAAFWNSFDRANRSTGVALLCHARALAAAGNESKAADALRQARAVLANAGLPADQALLQQTQRELRGRTPQS